MGGTQLATERTQSPEPLDRIPANSIAAAQTEELATSRGTRKTAKSPSVSFDVQVNPHPSPRTNTFASEKSTASSIFDPPWQKQNVLSFDGGGIRGYSSLLIIQKLMDFIVEEELEQHRQHRDSGEKPFEPDKYSSYDPLPFPSHVTEPAPSDDDLEEISRRFSLGDWLEKRRKKELEPNNTKKPGNGINNTELEVQEATARAMRSKYLPCHYFDYMGGTSTGGLISILLSRLRMPIDEALAEYEVLGGYIFGHPRIFSIRGPLLFPRDKYSDERFVEVVKQVVDTRLPRNKTQIGDHLFMSHERMCKTIAVAFEGHKVEDETATEIQAPYLFRSYDHHPHVPANCYERNPGHSQRVRIWQVARATSAAPTYFDSITIDNCKYGDGGFGANNPISEIYHEVCQMNGNEKKCIGLLMSVGTGLPKRVERYNKSSIWKYLAFMKVARKLASDSEQAHREIDRTFGTDTTDRVPYYRFNVPYKQPKPTIERQAAQQPPITSNHNSTANGSASGSIHTTEKPKPTFPKARKPHRKPTPLGDMKLDEWRSTTLSSIKKATCSYLSDPDVSEELRTIAKNLVSNRRARSQTIHWDLYSTGTQYRCMHDGCYHVKAHKMRPHDRNLRRHLMKSHGVILEEQLEDFVTRGRCEY